MSVCSNVFIHGRKETDFVNEKLLCPPHLRGTDLSHVAPPEVMVRVLGRISDRWLLIWGDHFDKL